MMVIQRRYIDLGFKTMKYIAIVLTWAWFVFIRCSDNYVTATFLPSCSQILGSDRWIATEWSAPQDDYRRWTGNSYSSVLYLDMLGSSNIIYTKLIQTKISQKSCWKYFSEYICSILDWCWMPLKKFNSTCFCGSWIHSSNFIVLNSTTILII